MRRTGVVLLLSLAGCQLLGFQEDGLRRVTLTDTTDNSGSVTFDVDVTEGESSLLLTAEASGPSYVVFYRLVSPEGDTVIDAESLWLTDYSMTGGVFPGSVVSLNWPILSNDAALTEGRWEVTLRTTNAQYYYEPGVSVDFEALFKQDDVFSEGAIDVNIIYAGGIDQDPDFVAATEAAVEYWQEMYGDVRIVPRFSYQTYSDGDLPPPGEGAANAYTAISDSTPLRSVNVVIVPSISGYEGQGLYGISGGIPGPLTAGPTSAVAVDALTNAGPDMQFSEEELRIYGETLAHEVGHFLGIFHPVEADFTYYDAVADTDQCSGRTQCESALGNNLMFPYPVCDWSSCVPQNELTGGQSGVAQRYVGME